MDRLVIGDVGYGKTEVALRAAALTALSGYQVVLAAPTTVLVRQHLQTFERRFAGTGLRVAALSRLSTPAEKKAVKAGLSDGSIGVVIGTAAVMGKDARFANLGLVVIDEEQRFGAADKAKLRGRADIHLLAMSATPIPRTLHRALIGLQQISVIATPPARRQPIRTSLAQLDDTRIRTALLRERSRGGQSFVVVPRIADLAPFSERLRRIVPDLELIEAHGKLPAAEIDAAMVRFADGQGDVLLATNIIEAGLDVPRANTMIVWHAERFGLAQLHQLRGRVGRGNRRGQVMLLTEPGEIAEPTMKRLRTLATYDQLGAGFEISAADLDQRGAGDPLSDTQAGHMKLIGVDLYQHLFEAALRQARGEDAGLWRPEVNMSGGGALPVQWIPDEDIRLGLYVRLARTSDQADLDALEEELVDRFGPLPPAAQELVMAARIAILARHAQVARIDAGPAAIALTPRSEGMAVPEALGLVEKDRRWLLKERTEEEERGTRIMELLETLSAEA
jgi:transcription-repair coupling factor (superfamily II helicase)